MIRAARLIAALSGAEEKDPELSSLSTALLNSGTGVQAIVNTVVLALEEHERDAPPSSGSWGPATALGAVFAAVGGGLGLRAMIIHMLPADAPPSWILPLFALPLALFAIFRSATRMRSRHADQRERFAVSLSLALGKLGLLPKLALRTGIVVSALDGERAQLLLQLESNLIRQLAVRKSGLAVQSSTLLASKAAPALAAVWAIVAFWILYFGTAAQSMIRGLPE
jgi:hypothetical protein